MNPVRTIEDSSQPNLIARKNKERHRRKRIFGALLTIGFLGTGIVYGLTLGTDPGRTEFVGNVDAPTHYRCSFQVAENWRVCFQRYDLPSGISPTVVDMTSFHPDNANWLLQQLHRLKNPGADLTLPIIDFSTIHFDSPRYLSLSPKTGYPEPNLMAQEDILSERHLRIDGFPATVVRTDRVVNGTPLRGTMLLVAVPASSLRYEISGWTAVPNFPYLDHEMQAMISSFHVQR